MELQKVILQEFPFMEKIIYLNVCSVSLPPISVQNAYTGFVRDYVARNGVGARNEAYKMIQETRRKIGELIHCEPEEVAYTPNTTQGISILQECLDWKPGDNVIISDLENFANLYQWKNLERKGVELRIVASRDGAFSPGDVESLMDQRTRVVSVSSVAFETGFNADVTEIGRICRERGVIFAVDIMQSVGRLKIDVKEMNIDFAATGSHKALLCSYGNGFIYCSKELQGKLWPVTASKESLRVSSAPEVMMKEGLQWHEDARKFEAGNFNFAGIYAMSKAIQLLLDIGTEVIEDRVLSLERHLRSLMSDMQVLKAGLADKAESWSGMVIVYFPQDRMQEVKQALEENSIYVTLKNNYLRIGIDFYNTYEQMETTAQVLLQLDKKFQSE